jgi:uncharacterized protein
MPWVFAVVNRVKNGYDQPTMKPRIIEVKVKPNARESELLEQADGPWQAKLKSPPVDGKANAELIGLVAKHFQCAKACVSIKTGSTGRIKRVMVDNT